MKSPKVTLHLSKRQLQKHFYHYLRLVRRGTCIQICESRRKPDPIAMMVPHDWYVEAVDLDAWPVKEDGVLRIASSNKFDEEVLAGMVAEGMTREEALIALVEEGLKIPGYPALENREKEGTDNPPTSGSHPLGRPLQ